MKNTFLLSFYVLLMAGQAFSQNANIDCNDAQAIKQYFAQKGFESSPITILSTADKVDANMIVDHAQLIVKYKGADVNMAEMLQETVKAGASEGFNAVAIVTKNENLCNADLKRLILNDFDKDKYDTSVNAHIWDNPNSTEDLLFIRYNAVNLNR